jgi:hypothetical protein
LASPAPASEPPAFEGRSATARRGPVALVAALAVGIAAAGGVLWWRARGGEATAGPAAPAGAAAEARGARPSTLPELTDGAAERNRRLTRQPASLQSHEVGAKTYADAVAAGEKNPGEKAFRADALAFFEHNGDLAEEKAAKEGITTDELKELTYMGLLAMHVRRWDEVARVTRRELTADERARGDELVFSASNELKAAIRAQVAKGEPAQARWETIKKIQASFVDRYKEIVKISPEDYDRLLALPFVPGGG